MRNSNFLSGLIGPYGGTRESEVSRPITIAATAIVIFAIMLILFVCILLLCGSFVGPVVLMASTLLSRRGGQKSIYQEKTLNSAYWVGVALTCIAIYFGGFPVGYEVGQGRLWIWVTGIGSTSFPLWYDTYRWLLVAVICGAEFALGLLVTRLLTEILFPSLANSVRAVQGTLNGIVPFMRIKNFDSDDDDISIDDGVFPESVDAAPLR